MRLLRVLRGVRQLADLVEEQGPAVGALRTSPCASPVLLVRADDDVPPALKSFASVEKVGDRMLPAGEHAQRHVTFYSLAGYKGQ